MPHKPGSTLSGIVHTYIPSTVLTKTLPFYIECTRALTFESFWPQIAVKEALKMAREFDDIAKYLGTSIYTYIHIYI